MKFKIGDMVMVMDQRPPQQAEVLAIRVVDHNLVLCTVKASEWRYPSEVSERNLQLVSKDESIPASSN